MTTSPPPTLHSRRRLHFSPLPPSSAPPTPRSSHPSPTPIPSSTPSPPLTDPPTPASLPPPTHPSPSKAYLPVASPSLLPLPAPTPTTPTKPSLLPAPHHNLPQSHTQPHYRSQPHLRPTPLTSLSPPPTGLPHTQDLMLDKPGRCGDAGNTDARGEAVSVEMESVVKELIVANVAEGVGEVKCKKSIRLFLVGNYMDSSSTEEKPAFIR
ncbi:hypothetical protein Tco_1264358 [Tanacetum coccineum]